MHLFHVLAASASFATFVAASFPQDISDSVYERDAASHDESLLYERDAYHEGDFEDALYAREAAQYISNLYEREAYPTADPEAEMMADTLFERDNPPEADDDKSGEVIDLVKSKISDFEKQSADWKDHHGRDLGKLIVSLMKANVEQCDQILGTTELKTTDPAIADEVLEELAEALEMAAEAFDRSADFERSTHAKHTKHPNTAKHPAHPVHAMPSNHSKDSTDETTMREMVWSLMAANVQQCRQMLADIAPMYRAIAENPRTETDGALAGSAGAAKKTGWKKSKKVGS
ncbi:hypothetical protein MMC11_006373 [Xylographa trunciseda]|nr:hypothetical protein [Xylographa trunciseda]